MAAAKSFGYASLTVGILYILLSMLCIYTFGSGIGNDYPTILSNLKSECADSECSFGSKVLRIMFLVVIASHTPFIFNSGKEGLHIIIDEIDRKSSSKALEFKIYNNDLINKIHFFMYGDNQPEY